MDISLSDFLSIAGYLFGGGSIGGLLTWRWTRRKEKAEAQTAEVNMAKEVQDIYQQALKDKDEELNYYKRDGEQQRKRLDDMDSKVRELERKVARNVRMVEAMRPLMCGDMKCKKRQRVAMSDVAEIKKDENEDSN